MKFITEIDDVSHSSKPVSSKLSRQKTGSQKVQEAVSDISELSFEMTEEDYQRIKRNYDEDEKVEKQKEEEMFKKLVM